MFKVGYGPMSLEIIDLLQQYSKDESIMVVASRNQVDYNRGYVCNTRQLVDRITDKSNLLICRDHCGPGFSSNDGSIQQAINECKHTIIEDIDCGFNIIHIDVSRIPDNQLKYAEELIEFTLRNNPNITLEFGSEDNTGLNINDSLDRIDEQLAFIKTYKDHIRYFVTQTGSYTLHRQMGNFDVSTNSIIAEKIHRAGFLFKEHNADYLTSEQLELRKTAGIDALNVAPQLGCIQTTVLHKLAKNKKEWRDFAELVYKGNNWKRWVPEYLNDKALSVIASGHYHFNSTEYHKLLDSIDVDVFHLLLKAEIFTVLNNYKEYF
jgi:hypothetical protein